MLKVPKFSTIEKTNRLFSKMAKTLRTKDVAIVKNPEYIYPLFDFYALAPKIKKPLKEIYGIICDMDGTTTTTETLCLHSLEVMVRRITDREDAKKWRGLDHQKDYPNIIGNSTTKHVEYLIKTYSNDIKKPSMKMAYFKAALWTLLFGQDEGRRKDVLDNLKVFGVEGLLKDKIFIDFAKKQNKTFEGIDPLADLFFKQLQNKFILEDFNNIVRAAIDIYYHRYHEILWLINAGRGKKLSLELFADPNKRLIEPMPGVGVYLAAMKGWLGKDLSLFYKVIENHLIGHLVLKRGKISFGGSDKNDLVKLGNYFAKNPAKIAIVTSSIFYEANIVLNEVFRVVVEQIDGWPISSQKKKFLKEKFSSYRNIYDCFITASDSSEIRLKPHRDLYSIALHRLGLIPKDFDKIIGYEDSESGTIAIRAAGVGKCVAVPFSDTAGHNLNAAVHILNGGLFEALFVYNGFLDKKSLN
jgi:beta-phosphoglucomutase-like phosphatase (HAD superfamily)